jgi:hypothetical protein
MRSLEGLYSLTFAERKDIMIASATPTHAYYTFFEDSGHGWLKVPVSELIELGIENDISHYSYMFGDWAYLEEDCDMARFIDAQYMRGLDVRWNSKVSQRSMVRNYPRYDTRKVIGG